MAEFANNARIDLGSSLTSPLYRNATCFRGAGQRGGLTVTIVTKGVVSSITGTDALLVHVVEACRHIKARLVSYRDCKT